MIKFMVVCHRRPDWSHDQFRRYFRETHGPLAMAIPGVRRYVQNFAEAGEGREPDWDAVIEFWFEDRAAMDAAWKSEAGPHRRRRSVAAEAGTSDQPFAVRT